MRWDPGQYARFSDQRSRPFADLLAQVGAAAPRRVLDIGCGSGELTATLAERWPGAEVVGVDSSAEMLERAPRDAGVRFEVARAQDLDVSGYDVVVSNAALQWVPEHRTLLSTWAGQLLPGGWLAFQVPANLAAPSHALMREVAAAGPWAETLRGVLRDALAVAEPDAYLDLLTGAGLVAGVWQTDYLHVLQGADPVLEWVRGTGLRPVLAALSEDEGAAYTAAYAARLREAYPARAYGTVLGFRRTFAVAQRPAPS